MRCKSHHTYNAMFIVHGTFNDSVCGKLPSTRATKRPHSRVFVTSPGHVVCERPLGLCCWRMDAGREWCGARRGAAMRCVPPIRHLACPQLGPSYHLGVAQRTTRAAHHGPPSGPTTANQSQPSANTSTLEIHKCTETALFKRVAALRFSKVYFLHI